MLCSMKKAAVAATMMGVVASVGASGASGATSFHVGSEAVRLGQTGTMNFTASAGASRLVINNSVKLECTPTTATGKIVTGIYPNTGIQDIGDVIPAFGNCTGPLGLGFTVLCSNPTGATTDLAVTGIGTPFTGTVDSEISNIKCVVTFTATGCTANVTGLVQGSYQNPSTPATPAVLTVFTAGQSLTVSASGCPTLIPNGTAVYGAPVGTGVGLANINYTVSGAVADQPYVTPTP